MMNKAAERAGRLADKLDVILNNGWDPSGILAKAKLADLHYLEFWNMGWSGVVEHPMIAPIKAEIEKRYLDEA